MLLLLFFITATFVSTVRGDDLYSEGFYDHANLPGGKNDERAEPNVPFTTITNRYADGITSTSAYDVASPRFPYYKGASANVADRYESYIKYTLSAIEQGVSVVGAGDAERETARLAITNQENYELLPKPSKSFSVYAAVKWNPSDFAIQEGETYNVTVYGDASGYGSQFWNDGGLRVNSEGYSSYYDAVSHCYVGFGRCRPHLKKKRRLPTANWMSLACAIGEFVRPLTEVRDEDISARRWIPLDEATLTETIFDVGRTVQFRAIYSGQLICFANDAQTQYWNNFGELNVTVTRESWPPKSDTVYLDAYLPSCDSAQVVYKNRGNNEGNDTVVKCNPNGGGAGWRLSDVVNTAGGYSSGAPDSIFNDDTTDDSISTDDGADDNANATRRN